MRYLAAMLLFLLALTASATEPDHVVTDSSPVDLGEHATFLWQGFDHTWERRALGFWRVPHRVSRFHTGPHDEHHLGTTDGVRSSGHWYFAQSTGVDGDYMRPKGFYTRVIAPEVRMVHGRHKFTTQDEAIDRRAPEALVTFDETIRIDKQAGEAVAVTLVRGVGFGSRCLDGPELCNSDGIWPYRFGVELGTCKDRGDHWACPVHLEVGRAWTPGKGGIRGVEVKPAAERMFLEVELEWVVLLGDADALHVMPVNLTNQLPNTRRIQDETQRVTLPVTGGHRYNEATVGWSAFAFEFVPPGPRPAFARKGRYLSGWSMRVGQDGYDPHEGDFVLAHAGGLSLPRSVWKTAIDLELGITVLQFSDAALTPGVVEGNLCANSNGAPFFSAWYQCEKLTGVEQLEDRVDIVVD